MIIPRKRCPLVSDSSKAVNCDTDCAIFDSKHNCCAILNIGSELKDLTKKVDELGDVIFSAPTKE